MKGETFDERQWPVDRLLTAHWSVSEWLCHTLVSLSNSGVSLSFNHLEASLALSLSHFQCFSHFRTLSLPLYHHSSGKLQLSSVLISSQCHQWGFWQWEVLLVSRVIALSPWCLTFNSCCLIGEYEQYWWLITWMFSWEEVADSQGLRLRTANVVLLKWRIACYFSASTVTALLKKASNLNHGIHCFYQACCLSYSTKVCHKRDRVDRSCPKSVVSSGS